MTTNRQLVSDLSSFELLVWNKMRDGDMGALGDLYDLFIDDLFSYGCRCTDDRQLILDSIHDLFVDLHKYSSGLSETTSVRFYLMGSLKRKLFKKESGQAIMIPLESEMCLSEENAQSSIEDELVIDEIQSERSQWLGRALAFLSKKQRTGIKLKYERNHTYEEIAEIMNISVPSARTTVYRALKTLKELGSKI